MAQADGTTECRMTLSSDDHQQPLLHVLMADGRVTEFRTVTIVVPESPRDEIDNRVFGLMVNGRGEVYVDKDGNPILLEAPPLTLHAADNPEARLTWAEVADRAGASLSTVRRAVQDGKLAPATVLGKRGVRFRLAEVQAWLDSTRRPSAVPLEEWMRQRAVKARS